jgi:hypothetical protein
MHKEIRSACFLVWPQNQGRRFLGLASKPRSAVSPNLTSKPVVLGFSVWASKPTATVWWFGPQKQAGYDLSVVPQNRWKMKTVWDTRRDLAACFAWKQIRLGFPSLASRLVEAQRGWSQRSRRDEAEDGRVNATSRIGLLYPNFVVFTVLGPRGISVFLLGL